MQGVGSGTTVLEIAHQTTTEMIADLKEIDAHEMIAASAKGMIGATETSVAV